MPNAISLPPVNSQLPVEDEDGNLNGHHAEWPAPWGNFFTKVYTILLACSQSGTTAKRPTDNLFIGQVYFDTSLGIPIWCSAFGATATWVDATGTPV